MPSGICVELRSLDVLEQIPFFLSGVHTLGSTSFFKERIHSSTHCVGAFRVRFCCFSPNLTTGMTDIGLPVSLIVLEFSIHGYSPLQNSELRSRRNLFSEESCRMGRAWANRR